MTESNKPTPAKRVSILICSKCNGYGKTFEVTAPLTCVECGGSGLLKIINHSTVRKIPLQEEQDRNWYDFDYTGESRSRSLERNGVISFTDVEFDNNSEDDIL